MWNYVEDLAILGPCSLDVLFIRMHQLHFGLLQASTSYVSIVSSSFAFRFGSHDCAYICMCVCILMSRIEVRLNLKSKSLEKGRVPISI